MIYDLVLLGLGLERASELLYDEVGLSWCKDSGGWLVVGLGEAGHEPWRLLYPLFEADGCRSRGDVGEEENGQFLESVCTGFYVGCVGVCGLHDVREIGVLQM